MTLDSLGLKVTCPTITQGCWGTQPGPARTLSYLSEEAGTLPGPPRQGYSPGLEYCEEWLRGEAFPSATGPPPPPPPPTRQAEQASQNISVNDAAPSLQHQEWPAGQSDRGGPPSLGAWDSPSPFPPPEARPPLPSPTPLKRNTADASHKLKF